MDRQKVLLIFGGAWVSAALLTWFLYAQTTGPRTEKTNVVIAASRDVPAGTRLRKADLKKVKIPEKDMPKAAVVDEPLAIDRVTLYPLNANEAITTTKLVSSQGAEGMAATIEPGKRAISVQVTEASAAGLLIQPRSHVDVLFTRTGTMREAVTATILQDVMVLSIGRQTEVQAPSDPTKTSTSSSTSVTTSSSRQLAATLLVTPEDAKKLELARQQGKISLALRNPLDKTLMQANSAATAEDIDPALFAGAKRTVRGGPIPNIRNDQVWGQLTGADPKPVKKEEPKKEPEKPKLVVDVYRGDKHVQEIFQ